MKNPVLNSYFTIIKFSIIVICVAVIYAFITCGTGTFWPYVVSDACLTAVLLFFEVVFLWNILQYGTPSVENGLSRVVFLAVSGLFFISLIIGLELLGTYLWFDSYLELYADSVIERIFILSLLYTIASMFYLSRIEASDIEEDNFRQEMDFARKKNESSAATFISRITIKSGTGIKVIPIEEIDFIKADGDYISIHTSEGSFLKEQTMKSIEEQLPNELFSRVHRSYIINTSFLTRIERYGQQQLVQMRSGEKIKISPTGYKVLKNRLGL